MNYLIHYLFGQFNRFAEIAFSGHQNAENRHNETLEK